MKKEEYVLLIDGDNISSYYLPYLVEHIKDKFGGIAAIHLFGRMDSPYIEDWKNVYKSYDDIIVTYNISENKKNSTDIYMVHIAWKLFYRDHVRKFVVVSSDSDLSVVVSNLQGEADVMVAYCPCKVGNKYLKFLRDNSIPLLNLDELSGEVSEKDLAEIITSTAHKYLAYKLSDKFFSYDTIIEWITKRHSELNGKLSKEILLKHLTNCQIRFESDGVTIT